MGAFLLRWLPNGRKGGAAGAFPSRWLPGGGRGGAAGAFPSRWLPNGGRGGADGTFPSRWLPNDGKGDAGDTVPSRWLPDGGRGRWLRDGGPLAETNSGSDLRAFPSSGNLRVKTTWKSATEQLLMRCRKYFFLFYNIHLLGFLLSTLHYTFEMILWGAPCYTPLKNLCVPMNVWDVSYGLNAAKIDYNHNCMCAG